MGGKHGERRGGQKTPLCFLLFDRPGGSVPCRDRGAGLRGRKPGACLPAGESPGLAVTVRACAGVGAAAAGVGEATVQRRSGGDAQHFILVNVTYLFSLRL